MNFESFLYLNRPPPLLPLQFRALKDPGNWRPVLLVTSIFILRELGGAMVIFMYAVYFFENAGVQLDPFTCSVLLGVCRVVFTFISAVTIDKLGRRPLLICSSVVCGLSMFVTGAWRRIPSRMGT